MQACSQSSQKWRAKNAKAPRHQAIAEKMLGFCIQQKITYSMRKCALPQAVCLASACASVRVETVCQLYGSNDTVRAYPATNEKWGRPRSWKR